MSKFNAGELKMTFDPNTIQHLGIKMYSFLPDAIAELVANAYDACSSDVEILIIDNDENREIIVKDNGIGMSFEDINNQFLIIGRNRRDEGMKETPCGRIASGKKGLGKLALFGIGGKVEILTTKKGDNYSTNLSLVWGDLKKWNREKDGPDYKPYFKILKCSEKDHGTSIKILELKRKTKIDELYIKDLAVSLSRLFNFLDDDFKVKIIFNNDVQVDVTNDLKYGSVDRQFDWKFPDYCEQIDKDYSRKNQISGEIFTSPTPLANKKQTGITLFAHGRRINEAEFFGHLESSNFFSYATGWLNVDFVDDYDEELISTDRKSISWEDLEMIELRNFLKTVISKIHADWRQKRKKEDVNKIQLPAGINKEKWFATLPPDKAQTIIEAIEEVSDPDSKRKPSEILAEASYSLAPEYAERHWRYLNKEIISDENVDRLYKGQNYFQAASESVKLYISKVRKISGITTTKTRADYTLMGEAFGREFGKVISLTDRSDVIEEDIEEGHRRYSEGVVVGFKNPVTSHATEKELKDRGLFTEKDCLDILSLLSHLFGRLDKIK